MPLLFHAMPVFLWPQVRVGLIAIGCSTALSLPFSTFTAIFIGLQRYTYPTLVATLQPCLVHGRHHCDAARHRQPGQAWRWSWPVQYRHGAGHLSAGTSWPPIARPVPPRRCTAYPCARLFRYCGVLSIWTLGGLFISGLDTLIVGHFDFRNTGYYAVAASATNFAIMLLGSLVSPLMPATASFGVVSTPERMGALLLRASRYSNLLLFLIALPLFMGGYFLLRLWVGADYAQHALVFLRILLAANVLRYLVYVYTVMVVAGGSSATRRCPRHPRRC